MSEKAQSVETAPAIGPERRKTNESLRSERQNADELVETLVAVEADTDALTENVREQTDAVRDRVRDTADRKQNASDDNAVVRERALGDEVLRRERAASDEILRRERAEQAIVTAALLEEREKTDRYLLTERARSDDALAHRDDFLGMVSHDMRNLVNGISLRATLLSAQASDSEEGRRTVDGMKHIQDYLQRMGRLISDLIDVDSIDLGKFAVQMEPSDGAAVLADAVDPFMHLAADKGVGLLADAHARSLPGEFDRDRVLQVISNLLGNALKFTPKGGAIIASVARSGEDLQFSVRDSGIGIPADMLEAVFERFWQVGANEQRGLGLGLYISRCIVNAHGGRIWAESTPGEGSVFTFTLPVRARAA